MGSKLYEYFSSFVCDNNLLISDMNRLSNVFTYCNDAGTASSWIDHVVCSTVIDSLICSTGSISDFVTSDHKPQFVYSSLSCNVILNPRPDSNNVDDDKLVDWTRVDVDVDNLQAYEYRVDQLLCQVSIPNLLLSVSSNNTPAAEINNVLEQYYNTVGSRMRQAGLGCLPTKCYNVHDDHIIPGWNEIVRGKHQLARDAFYTWVISGRPRQGPELCVMKNSRAQFKLALRYCKKNIDMLRADLYADSLADKDYNKFWNHIKKTNNGKSTKFANHVGGCSGCSGPTEIAAMWRQHFDELYNSVEIGDEMKTLSDRIMNNLTADTFSAFTIRDIHTACSKQKCGKTVGLDNVAMEAIVHGGGRLFVHICVLFNMF